MIFYGDRKKVLMIVPYYVGFENDYENSTTEYIRKIILSHVGTDDFEAHRSFEFGTTITSDSVVLSIMDIRRFRNVGTRGYRYNEVVAHEHCHLEKDEYNDISMDLLRLEDDMQTKIIDDFTILYYIRRLFGLGELKAINF